MANYFYIFKIAYVCNFVVENNISLNAMLLSGMRKYNRTNLLQPHGYKQQYPLQEREENYSGWQ